MYMYIYIYTYVYIYMYIYSICSCNGSAVFKILGVHSDQANFQHSPEAHPKASPSTLESPQNP